MLRLYFLAQVPFSGRAVFHKSHVWLADVQGLERQPFSWRRRRMHTGQTALSLLVCLQYLCSCGSLSRDFPGN